MPLPRPVLLMTRPVAASQAFVADVHAALGRTTDHLISPLMQIVPLPMADNTHHSGLVFTSAHGVQAARDAGVATDQTAWCVGVQTGQAARKAGFHAIVADGDASGLIDLITRHMPTGPLLHLRGQHSVGDVADRLTAAGVPTISTVVYDQRALPLSSAAKDLLGGTRPVVIPLFSPRTATMLATQGPYLAPLNVIALSEQVALGFGTKTRSGVYIVDAPQRKAMIIAVVCALDRPTIA